MHRYEHTVTRGTLIGAMVEKIHLPEDFTYKTENHKLSNNILKEWDRRYNHGNARITDNGTIIKKKRLSGFYITKERKKLYA